MPMPAPNANPTPPRKTLPYSRQALGEADISAVVEVLRSDWLTTGPAVERFEAALAQETGAVHVVAVSSGTAALHAAMFALEIGPGDEVIVPAMTFAATANAVLYQGGRPIFADVDRGTLLLDPAALEALISPRTKAIVAVDYAGQPCDYEALRAVACRHDLPLVADAAHSLGARDGGRPVGSLADLTTFSFHPVKAITTGEGGAVATNDARLAARIRRFRNHGIDRDGNRVAQCNSPPDVAGGAWHRPMVELGYNYRLTDIQSALGLSQLKRLEPWLARRRAIAGCYDAALAALPGVQPLRVRRKVAHAYHLYVVSLDAAVLGLNRAEVHRQLHARGIAAQVHYLPVYLHPYYRQRFGTRSGLCPAAEAAYERILSLPLFPAMSDDDVADVLAALEGVVGAARHGAAGPPPVFPHVNLPFDAGAFESP